MKLHVGNLSKQVTEAQLNELAVPYGTVVATTLATEKGSGTSRGFGFIEFSNSAEGNAAMKGLDGRAVDGQSIKVSEARPRVERGAGS
jgi:RNA recognition motif-containing protein